MKIFLADNSAELTEFSTSFFQSIAKAKQLKNLPSFFHDAIACGVALAMREVYNISLTIMQYILS